MASNGGAHKKDEGATQRVSLPASASAASSNVRDLSTEQVVDEDGGGGSDGGFEREERPTTVPDYDVGALAAASFQPAKKVQLPLDLSIPVRKAKASVCGAPLRAAFLLSHVDDRMSIAEIASSAQIPIGDAVENFVLLADLGLVELRGGSHVPPQPQTYTTDAPSEKSRPPTPKSGLRAKT
jgi:hypothetical protein